MTKDYKILSLKEVEQQRYYRVTANIDVDAICDNISNIKELAGEKTKIMAIMKADGYGHGAIPIAQVLDHIGVDAFGIAIIEEGIQLRNAGIEKTILILGYTPKEQYKELVEYNISQTIFQYDLAKELSEEALRQNKVAPVHIKVDTGMTRLGFRDTEESIEEIKKISLLKGVKIEGIFSHFACADEADKTSAHNQLNRFMSFVNRLEEEGLVFPIKHIANSAGIIDLPEAKLDMVRSGIATYGLYPSEEVNKEQLKLTPALELKSHVSFVKDVEPGIGISYGSTYVTKDKIRVATIPVGYGDGYPRQLSSLGRVLIHGRSAPILGRVCMDQFMVDVTHIHDVKQGDAVTLIGRDGEQFISAEEIGSLVNSFNYEVICNIGKRIPRIYNYKNKIYEINE